MKITPTTKKQCPVQDIDIRAGMDANSVKNMIEIACHACENRCSKPIEKPPLGLMPARLHREHRMLDILTACKRKVKAGATIPKEWIRELATINSRLDKDKSDSLDKEAEIFIGEKETNRFTKFVYPLFVPSLFMPLPKHAQKRKGISFIKKFPVMTDVEYVTSKIYKAVFTQEELTKTKAKECYLGKKYFKIMFPDMKFNLFAMGNKKIFGTDVYCAPWQADNYISIEPL